jgi:hypothetical protein
VGAARWAGHARRFGRETAPAGRQRNSRRQPRPDVPGDRAVRAGSQGAGVQCRPAAGRAGGDRVQRGAQRDRQPVKRVAGGAAPHELDGGLRATRASATRAPRDPERAAVLDTRAKRPPPERGRCRG